MNPNADGTNRPEQTRSLLGPVRQVGYVVQDVEAAARDWVNRAGIGPWRVRHGIALNGCLYRGNEIDVELTIASAYSSGIEIELIAQTGGPASMYSDFLTNSGPSAQHVCFYPADYFEARRHLLENGMTVALEGQIGSIAFAYLDDGMGQVVEIADLPADAVQLRIDRAAAAPDWDGVDPIRVRS